MSRIGKLPVKLPEGVDFQINGQVVKADGPKGSLELEFPKELSVKIENREILVEAKTQSDKARAMHGTVRALLANMAKGVSEGWTKSLELVGTGYRAEVSGNTLTVNVGYSHPIKFEAPEGVSFKVEKNEIKIDGIDREAVGLVAAKIRAVRPPEPYKGKGIKYVSEVIRRKAGKAAKAAGA